MNILIALTILAVPMSPPPNIPARPFVSCIDGHIVTSLAECPPLPKHGGAAAAPVGGGGGGGGILGGLLGGILG